MPRWASQQPDVPAEQPVVLGDGATAFRTLNDPRVSVTNQNRLAADQVNQVWTQNKFPSLTASFPITSGIETQLILAEARGGADGLAILNALRARSGVALPALAASTDFTQALIDERSRELFLQGSRWYDVRRFNTTLVPATGTAYGKGGVYGDQRCWPLPDAETWPIRIPGADRRGDPRAALEPTRGDRQITPPPRRPSGPRGGVHVWAPGPTRESSGR